MSIISDNLKKARKAIPDLSQEKAAKLIGPPVKRSNIGAWEEGRSTPPLSILPKILQVYGITDLFGFILNDGFDPKKQATTLAASFSIIDQKYKACPKKLRKVVDQLLNLD